MSKQRILIVDDNEDLRDLIRVTLEFSDYDIYEAEDGAHAMSLVKEVKPDVMILDIMMPGELDGLEVCRRVKKNEETSPIRVVLLSAMRGREFLKMGGSAGADSYLVKPFSPISLLETIQTEDKNLGASEK